MTEDEIQKQKIKEKAEAEEHLLKEKNVKRALGWAYRIREFVFKDNNAIYIILIVLGIYGWYKFEKWINKPEPARGDYMPARVKRPIISFDTDVIDDEQKKVIIKTKVTDKEGKTSDAEIDLRLDRRGNVYHHRRHADSITVVEKHSRVDLTIRLGLAAVINPEADVAKDMLEPGIVISPMEFYKKFSLDLIATHRRAGGGIGYRLPHRRFRNTYIGGAYMVPYENPEEKGGYIFLKVNF